MTTDIRQEESPRENAVTPKHAPSGPTPNPRGVRLTTYDLTNLGHLVERMMDNHRPAMRRFAAKHWKGSTSECINDIVQDACCHAWQNRSEIQSADEARIKNLLGLCILRAIDRAKYRAVRDPQSLNIPEDVPAKPAKGELRRTYADHIAALPPKHREVLNLHLDGYSNVKIAGLIGYAPGGCARETVRVLLKEAKAQLLEQVRDSDDCDSADSLFAQCSNRTEYIPPGDSWFPWIEMLPGDIHWTDISAMQRQSMFDHALANPDLQWNAMWTKLAVDTRFEDRMAIPEEFRHLCVHKKK